VCVLIAVGIRGEDAGTLVCYKMEEEIGEEDKARLELNVLGTVIVLCSTPSCFFDTCHNARY